MYNYSELKWHIDDINDKKDIDQEIKVEWIKNSVLDYLWPLFDFEHIGPLCIMPKGTIIITYDTLKFSEAKRNTFKEYDIDITDTMIVIDCSSKYIVEGVDNLKAIIERMKDMLWKF